MRRKKQLEEQKRTEKQIEDIQRDIDTLLSGIRDDITIPLYNLILFEDRLRVQVEDEKIHENCMKVQAAVGGLSEYAHREKSSDIVAQKKKIFSYVNEEIAVPFHEIKRSARRLSHTASDEGIKKDAEMMETYAGFLEAAVKNIFDTISIRAGGFRQNERRFHLSELISDVTFTVKNIAELKELDFECISDPDTPEFWVGDDVRTRQVVLDICNNSIRHTSDGLVRLYVSGNDHGGLTFVVSDTGNGSDEADDESNGMRVAEGLGGTVRTESVKGRGSEVIIDIPMKQGRQIADADGLLDTEEGLSYYDNNRDEYRQVLLLFCDTAPSYRDSILNDSENITGVMKSLYRASKSIGAKALSERLLSAINKSGIADDFTEIFDETMYRAAGYAGRR